MQVRRDGDRHVRAGLRARASAAPAGPGEQDHVEVLHVQRRRRVRLRRQRAPALALHLGEVHRHSGQNPARNQRFAVPHMLALDAHSIQSSTSHLVYSINYL